jgi:hypothetical protein
MLFLLHDSAPLGIITRLLGPFGSSWMNTANGMVPASFMQAVLVVHMRGFYHAEFCAKL